MFKKDPEGYRKLLAYQKAQALHSLTLQITPLFPKTKTFFDLADQMDRSARSGNKNIVEGWKRNTTQEYFNFLGFSIGAVEELKDDAADITRGVYPALMGIRGVTERMGEKAERGGMGEKGIKGERGTHFAPYPPYAPYIHLPLSRDELDKIPFYPLPPNLPPVVELFLKAKEVNFLLYRLQQSLDTKMDSEHTKPANKRIKDVFDSEKQANQEFLKYLETMGMQRLPNGQFVSQGSKGDKGKKGVNG